MKIEWARVFDVAALLALLTMVWINFAMVVSMNEAAWGLGFAFAVNAVLAGFGVFLCLRRNLPTMMVAFGFHYVFFGLAPLQQIALNFRGIAYFPNMTAILTLVFMATIACYVGFAFALKKQVKIERPGLMSYSLLNGKVSFVPLFLAATAVNIFLLFYFKDVLFTNREIFEGRMRGLGEQMFIVFHAYVLPFAVLAPIMGFGIAWKRRNYLFAFLFTLLALVGFLMVNPTTIARYQASAAIFALILVIFGWRNQRLLFLLFTAGLIVSPALGVFRYTKLAVTETNREHIFVHMDYEIIQFINFAIEYVKYYGVSWGTNITSSLLFFVPRSMWGDKSEHLGAVMSQTSILYGRYGTNNLSSPAGAEGYFAFGLIGGLVWSFAYPLTFAWMERKALRAEPYAPWQLVACALPSLVVITFRGPPAVGISETTGAIVIAAASGLLMRWRPLAQDTATRLSGRASWASPLPVRRGPAQR